MAWLIRLVFCSLILHTVSSLEDTKLQLVQMLFRHGDRAPILVYPTDPNTEDCWPEGFGKLTLLGRKQQYALGNFLRSRYQEFITTNPREVLVNSSAVDRCLTSAAVLMASLYAPEGRWKFEDDLHWQPIPIHYLPLEQDKFLSFRGKCPIAKAAVKQSISEVKQELFQKYQIQLMNITNYTGLDVFHGINAFYLYDTLEIEKMYNFTVPEWVDLYWEKIKEIADSIFRSFTKSPYILKFRTGPLLQDMLQNMRKKINGDLPNLKVQVYSAHDVNIAAILLALNFTDIPRPPYCATLLFELHEMNDTSMAVRLLYLNSTDPLANMEEPRVLQLEGCSEFCPIQNFTNRIRQMIPDDWERECQLDTLNTRDADNTDAFNIIQDNTKLSNVIQNNN